MSIQDVLIRARSAYYNGSPIISDVEYDKLESSYLDSGGKIEDLIDYSDNSETCLPLHMGSLDKVKYGSGDITKFISTLQIKGIKYIHVSVKLDGMSAMYYRGHFYTRGQDYDRGTCLDHILECLQLPHIPDHLAVRGELVIPVEEFNNDRWSSYMNTRNAVAGLACRKYSSNREHKLFKYIHFVAYELIDINLDRQMNINRQYKCLREYGFQVADHKYLKITDTSIPEDKLKDTYLRYRDVDGCQYDIDGLVIVPVVRYRRNITGNPNYAKAFKMQLDCQKRVIEVLKVEWNVTKTGKISPTVIFNPVNINGVNIGRATGKNAGFIRDNNIGPGAKLEIIRSGDVIPDINKVISVAVEPFDIPIQYSDKVTWNKSGKDLILTNKNVREVAIRNNLYFFQKIGAKGIGPVNANIFYHVGLKTPADFYQWATSRLDDGVDIVDLSPKIVRKIHTSIQESLHNCRFIDLSTAISLYGFGTGSKKIESLLEADLEMVRSTIRGLHYTPSSYYEWMYSKICKIKGFAPISAKTMCHGYIDNISGNAPFQNLLLDKLDDYIFQVEETSKVDKSLDGLKFYITGVRNNTLKEQLLKLGATESSSTFNILIIKDHSINNLKVQKGKSNPDIQVLTIDEAVSQYM